MFGGTKKKGKLDVQFNIFGLLYLYVFADIR